MSIGIAAQGTLYKLNSVASPSSFTTIPETCKLTCPSSKFDLLELTSHDSSGFKEWVPGMSDGGTVSAEINFAPSNAVHISLRTQAYAKTLVGFQIIFPGAGSGGQMAYNAYIDNFPPVADVNTVLKSNVSSKVTGQITWT